MGRKYMKKLDYKRIGDSNDMVSLKCHKCGSTLIDYQKDMNKAWAYHIKVCGRKLLEAKLVTGGKK